MGYALPGANALCLAFPGETGGGRVNRRRLAADARSEISVAAEHAVAPIYVAWMDGALAQIETKQLRQSLRPVGARLPQISSAKVADAFRRLRRGRRHARRLRPRPDRRAGGPVTALIGVRVDQSCRAEWYELLRG